MSKYIDAEKLKAEIKRRKFEWEAILNINNIDNLISKNCCYEDDAILDFIDSLQQEHPGADLEEEVKSYIKDNFTITDEVAQIPEKDRMYSIGQDDMVAFAEHFYKLGLNAKKED